MQGLPSSLLLFLNSIKKFNNTRALVFKSSIYEPGDEISNNVVCATSKASDQPAHTRSLIRAFARRLNIL